MTHRGTKWGVRRSTAFLSIFLIATFGLVGVQGAHAAPVEECEPSDAVAAAFSEWSSSGESTPLQHGDSTTPADPDGQDGDDNPLNLQMLGDVSTSVHGTGETDLVWHVWTGGPVEEAPSVDDEAWNGTSGNPQSENHSVPPQVPGTPYFVSHGGSGNGDWFLWKGEGITETDYQWDILSRTFTPGLDAVECEEPEVEGEEDEIPGKDSPNEPNPVQVAGEQAVAPPAVAPPTSVNAGLGESVSAQSDRSPLGLLMVMLGALLTAAAVTRRRARA